MAWEMHSENLTRLATQPTSLFLVRASSRAGRVPLIFHPGTSFLVMGTTSPDGGNYSVTLDNSQIFLSARSSFTNNETLLYYSSGLDPTVVHNLSIINEDGSHLILPVGGFRAFASMNPTYVVKPLLRMLYLRALDSPTASATSNGSQSGSPPYPAGTIAALVLAGVLVLVLSAWLLFYLLFYRPRMRARQHSGHSGSLSNSKEAEAGVLDIRPRGNSLPPDVYHPRRVSTGSEFRRWKRNAEGHGNLGVDLVFRHPDSTKEVDDHGNPVKSSDAPAQSQCKGKGKSTRWSKFGRHEKEGSSPGFTVDLPLPPAAATTSRQGPRYDSIGRGSRSSSSARSYLSTLSFASKKSSSSTQRQKDASSSSRPTVPTFHTRTSSQKPLLQFQGNSPVRKGSQPQPPPTTSLPRILVDDRGSVRYSEDVITRLGRQSVLRGLGPRTSERTRDPPQDQAIFADPPPRPFRQPDVSPVLNMRESSPFRVDFGSAAQRNRLPSGVGSAVGFADPSSSKRASGASHVRFEVSDASTTGETTSPVEEAQTPRPTSTPRQAIVSFLDLSSSDASTITQSSDHNHSEPRPRSGWSTATGTAPQETDHSSQSNSPHSPSSSAVFPFPTSLPASPHHPEGHRPSPPRIHSTLSDPHTHRLHQHPFEQPLSPSDSLPMSISASDLRFGRQGSDEAVLSSNNQDFLPPHPPLPQY